MTPSRETDIVERLGERIGHPHSHYISPDMQMLMDAKSEITTLRQRVKELEDGLELANNALATTRVQIGVRAAGKLALSDDRWRSVVEAAETTARRALGKP